MHIKEDYLQWFTSFLIKNLVEMVLLLPNQIINSQMNFINRLLFKRQKFYSSFRDNIWVVDLADTTKHALSEYNKGIKYLFCAIDLFRKCGWVFPLKDKRGISIVNAFQ